MSEARSSSNNRAEIACEAVVMNDQRSVGPIRLPPNRADDFIAHFNRTYRGLGIRLAPLTPPDNEKIPGNPKTAGDDR